MTVPLGRGDAAGDFDVDADGLAALLLLAGDGDGGAEDDDVEQGPKDVHHDGAEMVGVVHAGEELEGEDEEVEGEGGVDGGKLEVARDGGEDAEDVETEHEEIGRGDAAIEKGAIDDAALGRCD